MEKCQTKYLPHFEDPLEGIFTEVKKFLTIAHYCHLQACSKTLHSHSEQPKEMIE